MEKLENIKMTVIVSALKTFTSELETHTCTHINFTVNKATI